MGLSLCNPSPTLTTQWNPAIQTEQLREHRLTLAKIHDSCSYRNLLLALFTDTFCYLVAIAQAPRLWLFQQILRLSRT